MVTTIARANAGDVDGVVALWRACGLTRPWNDPTRDFNDALQNETSTVFVAKDDSGRIAGSVMVGYDGHRGWVYYLGVLPEARGNGLGGDLVGSAEAWLIEVGAPKVQLMVRASNTAALGFYSRLGYVDQDCIVLGRRFEPQTSGN